MVSYLIQSIQDVINRKRSGSAVFVDVGLMLEGKSLSIDEKRDVVIFISDNFHDICFDCLSSLIWAIGKFSDVTTSSFLKKIARMVENEKNHEIGWQFLIAYENIIGNKILLEYKNVFLCLNDISETDLKLSKTLSRFHG